MRQISEELTDILRDTNYSTNQYHNNALLYMCKKTFDDMREALLGPSDPPNYSHNPIGQLFGIPIMLYHGVPIGHWDLVQRRTGEQIMQGRVWQDEVPKIDTLDVHTYSTCPDHTRCRIPGHGG